MAARPAAREYNARIALLQSFPSARGCKGAYQNQKQCRNWNQNLHFSILSGLCVKPTGPKDPDQAGAPDSSARRICSQGIFPSLIRAAGRTVTSTIAEGKPPGKSP